MEINRYLDGRIYNSLLVSVTTESSYLFFRGEYKFILVIIEIQINRNKFTA